MINPLCLVPRENPRRALRGCQAALKAPDNGVGCPGSVPGDEGHLVAFYSVPEADDEVRARHDPVEALYSFKNGRWWITDWRRSQ